jgi:hypothetical protein
VSKDSQATAPAVPPATGAAQDSVVLGVEPSAPPAPTRISAVPAAVPQSVPVPQLPVAAVATPVSDGEYYGYAPIAVAELYVEE